MLDVKDLSGLALVGIAAIILALSIGYYLIKKKGARVKDSTQMHCNGVLATQITCVL